MGGREKGREIGPERQTWGEDGGNCVSSKQPKSRCHSNQKLLLDASVSYAKKGPPLWEVVAGFLSVLILEQILGVFILFFNLIGKNRML